MFFLLLLIIIVIVYFSYKRFSEPFIMYLKDNIGDSDVKLIKKDTDNTVHTHNYNTYHDHHFMYDSKYIKSSDNDKKNDYYEIKKVAEGIPHVHSDSKNTNESCIELIDSPMLQDLKMDGQEISVKIKENSENGEKTYDVIEIAEYKKEMPPDMFKNILKEFETKNKAHNSLELLFDNIPNSEYRTIPLTFDNVKKFILVSLSNAMIQYDTDLNVGHSHFVEVSNKINSFKEHKSLSQNHNLNYFDFKFIIHRPEKNLVYGLRCKVVYNINDGTCLIVSIDFLGVLTDDFSKNNGFYEYYNFEDKMCDSKGRHVSMIEDFNDGRCFFKKAKTKAQCLSRNEKGANGLWDTPCENNHQCPFYKKNKNYPNDRGKCINGYCELPLNMVRLGYKYYRKDKKYKPLCHNCNDEISNKNCLGKECSMCCDNQEKPDYAFENDSKERYKHKTNFKKNGMKYSYLKIR